MTIAAGLLTVAGARALGDDSPFGHVYCYGVKAFDRSDPPYSANLGILFDRWLKASTGDKNLACAIWNMIHDGRVSEEYAKAIFGDPVPASITQAELKYRCFTQDRIGTDGAGTYGSHRLNGTNILDARFHSRPRGNEPLSHVLDLSGFVARRIWRFGKEIPQHAAAVAALSPDDDTKFPLKLAAALSGKTRFEQRSVVSLFLAIRRIYIQEAGVIAPPTWAAKWEQFARRIRLDDAATWCAAVGLQKYAGAWVVLLRYPVSRVEAVTRMIRPAQAEASLFGRHFPVPWKLHAATGGRAVQGQLAGGVKPTGQPIEEFIHEPVDFLPGDWEATNTEVRQLSTNVGDEAELFDDRKEHFDLLLSDPEVGPSANGWMTQANP